MWWVETIQREAVYPWTSPDGIQDSVRLDLIAKESDILAGNRGFKSVEKKEEMDATYWDGGWPHGKINDPFVVLTGMVHECGHVMLHLPDLSLLRDLVPGSAFLTSLARALPGLSPLLHTWRMVGDPAVRSSSADGARSHREYHPLPWTGPAARHRLAHTDPRVLRDLVGRLRS